MTHRHNHYIRELLRKHTIGLTTGQIKNELKISLSSINYALKHMQDAYISRWVKLHEDQYIPVWAVAIVPSNAPKPQWLYLENTKKSLTPGRSR